MHSRSLTLTLLFPFVLSEAKSKDALMLSAPIVQRFPRTDEGSCGDGPQEKTSDGDSKG